VLDESRLNLGRRETVSADVDDVVNTSPDPVEPFVVAPSAVSGELRVIGQLAATLVLGTYSLT
jgi:hypothetical protein